MKISFPPDCCKALQIYFGRHRITDSLAAHNFSKTMIAGRRRIPGFESLAGKNT